MTIRLVRKKSPCYKVKRNNLRDNENIKENINKRILTDHKILYKRGPKWNFLYVTDICYLRTQEK